MKSCVFIIPAEHQADGNALAEQMGWGPNTYSVPLSETGLPPATHYCCRADVTEGFLQLLADPPEHAAPVLAVVTMDLSDEAGADHWPRVLAEAGLQILKEVDSKNG